MMPRTSTRNRGQNQLLLALLTSSIVGSAAFGTSPALLFSSSRRHYQFDMSPTQLTLLLKGAKAKTELRGQSNEDNVIQQEFDIDSMESIEELNDLSKSVGGPILSGYSSLESAKDSLWAFVEDTAEDDVDNMCMGQLSGLLLELGGDDFADGTTLREARDVVWDLANRGHFVSGECSCAGCSTKQAA